MLAAVMAISANQPHAAEETAYDKMTDWFNGLAPMIQEALDDDFTSACANLDRAECSAGLTRNQPKLWQAMAFISTHPAPACMQATVSELKRSLTLANDAYSLMQRSIDSRNGNLIFAASTLMKDSASAMESAAKVLEMSDAVKCLNE